MLAHPLTCPPGGTACAGPAARCLAFARPPGRAASRESPRRAPRSTNPRCLPSWAALPGGSRGTCSPKRSGPIRPGGRWAIVHRLFPACGYLTGAFSTPADWIRFDGRTRARAQALVVRSGPKAFPGTRTAAPPTTSAFRMIRGSDVPQNFREATSLFCHPGANKKTSPPHQFFRGQVLHSLDPPIPEESPRFSTGFPPLRPREDCC